ncbi:FIG139438: lipoprotein B [hydrothermal vent metagenome]|uniref:FIG139438: lipoprotein B n=1 Tax=hydrothermal vent metagenome TaxID=652676 RepID=A0A3B0Z4B3_9ZZZZ
MLTKLYDKVLTWSKHKYAEFYLGLMSFAESSFFPIPPDVMLAPMSLARPERAWYFAGLTTATSTLGGILGYAIGYFAYSAIEPSLIAWGYESTLVAIKQEFASKGWIFVFAAGFTPFPYKIITISAGAFHMAFLPFLLASIIGRGGRFFLVAGAMKYGGKRMENLIRRYINILSLLLVAALVAVYFIYKH